MYRFTVGSYKIPSIAYKLYCMYIVEVFSVIFFYSCCFSAIVLTMYVSIISVFMVFFHVMNYSSSNMLAIARLLSKLCVKY